MSREASLYRVGIGHRREVPVASSFRYSSYMWHFDLDAPPTLPLLLRPLARWRPSQDHLDMRARLASEGVIADRIEVLTNLAVLGYSFNPISVYWAYGTDGSLLAHAAEVHNTYGGRHAYVMKVDDRDGHDERVVSKAMYVSPFYPVDGSYRIRISEPSDHVSVSVVLERPGGDTFRASMAGRRVKASTAQVVRSFVRFPAAPLRARALIQFQGLRLWRRGLEVQPR